MCVFCGERRGCEHHGSLGEELLEEKEKDVDCLHGERDCVVLSVCWLRLGVDSSYVLFEYYISILLAVAADAAVMCFVVLLSFVV